jgi:putative aminopeptidase FrvX
MIGQIIERSKPLADDIEIDRIGNLTATFYGRSNDKEEKESTVLC